MSIIYAVDSALASETELCMPMDSDEGNDPLGAPGAGGGTSGAAGTKLDSIVLAFAGDGGSEGDSARQALLGGESCGSCEATFSTALLFDSSISLDGKSLMLAVATDVSAASDQSNGLSLSGDGGLSYDFATWTGTVFGTDAGLGVSGSLRAITTGDVSFETETPYPGLILTSVDAFFDDIAYASECWLRTTLGSESGGTGDSGIASEIATWTGTLQAVDSAFSGSNVFATGLIQAVDTGTAYEDFTSGSVLVGYYVYSNTGVGDPINYASPIATLVGFETTTYTTTPLAAPGVWSFGVRAFNDAGIEENLDCAVTIVLDAYGNDVSNVPLPPTGLRAFATPGGGIRVEWFYASVSGPKAPTKFNVYISVSPTLSYAAPIAVVPFSMGLMNVFTANISGSNGVTYAVGVRAANGIGEEKNTYIVSVTADSIGPTAVNSLIATAIV